MNRRRVLELIALAATGTLAGCSDVLQPPGESDPPPDSDGGLGTSAAGESALGE